MGTIKSAWEIALEKTQGLTLDKNELKRKESFKKGRAFGLKALENSQEWAQTELRACLEDASVDQASFIGGAVEAAIAPFQLSASGPLPIQQASYLFKLVTKKEGSKLFDQMQQVIQRYQDELENLREAIVQQLGPRLRQRAEQMARQAGVSTNYVMERDPEFLKIFNQNAENIRQQLQEYLDRLKAEIKRVL